MMLQVTGCLIYLLVVVTEITSTAAETVKVSTTPVFTAIPWGQQSDDFEVLVRVEAPAVVKRGFPIDLVAVLDVSDSMNAPATPFGGSTRLDLLKRAMKFIVRKLDDGDRLAIVAFNDQVVEEYSTDLLHISDGGRSNARRKVDELTAGGKTAFRPGLERAVKILEERPSDRNRVGFIVLLSDGIEKSDIRWSKESIGKKSRIRAVLRQYPVHTFGFSAGHDPKALLFIAQESRGGTYSFIIEDLGSITGAFAVCLGGLKTVVAVDTRVKLTAAEHGGVRIRGIDSGGYRSHISGDRTWGEIVVDVLYAGEVKNFIVRLQVPACDIAGGHQQLLVLAAGDSLYSSRAAVTVEAGNVLLSVHRPHVVDDAGRQAPSPAVVNHIIRFELLEVVARFVRHELEDLEKTTAVAVVDPGSRLQSRWEEFKEGHKFWTGVDLDSLDREMSAAASSLRPGGAGLAYVYSWLSSYQMQRATTMGSPDKVVAEFLTPAMRQMLKLAQEMPPTLEEPAGWHRPTTLIPPLEEPGEADGGPRSGCSCDCGGGGGGVDVNFERIDRRLELWSKLKREVPLLFQPPEAAESHHLTAVLREASLDAINRAMHHDMYLAVVHASKVRRCYSGGRAGRGAAAAAF